MLPVVLYGYEIWSLTLREVHRPRVFENRVVIKIPGPWRDEATGKWRRLHNVIFINCKWVGTRWQWLFYMYTECERSFVMCTHYKTLFRWSREDEWDGRGMWHVCWGRDVHTESWWGERGKEGRPRCRWGGNIRTDFEEVGYTAWPEIMWFRIFTGGWPLWMS
jgi:hypothetical protein